MTSSIVDLTREHLTDAFARPIEYLRISVTDKCNLRCVYCMPEGGLDWLRRDDILTYEEIVTIVRAAAQVGVRSIRLTGGEPLVRRDLATLVGGIAHVEGIRDISLSTNGLLLAPMLPALVNAGLKRVNVSLDTLRPDRFAAIARRDGLEEVLGGIDAAIAIGLDPVKINCVVMRGQNDDEIADFAALTKQRDVHVRFIEVMPVHENLGVQAAAYMSSDEIRERLEAVAAVEAVEGPPGNGPARYFRVAGGAGTVGVISPLSHEFCQRCNRVRLTADGKLRLCLFGDHHVDLRGPVRNGASLADVASILRSSMLIKPERHHLELGRPSSQMRAFSEIGG